MHARFNRYAEQAFEPCRVHFNEQAELRKRNLAECRRICEQLEEYLDNVDWASADMRAAEQIMRAARDEWRAHHPVDRRHAKEIDARFEALQERIFVQVKKVWDANLAAKQAIVGNRTEAGFRRCRPAGQDPRSKSPATPMARRGHDATQARPENSGASSGNNAT